jgi:hypothetical protein
MWLKGNPAQDARKARWYLERLIARLPLGGLPWTQPEEREVPT